MYPKLMHHPKYKAIAVHTADEEKVLKQAGWSEREADRSKKPDAK